MQEFSQSAGYSWRKYSQIKLRNVKFLYGIFVLHRPLHYTLLYAL